METKEVILNNKTFVLSKIPAIPARKIMLNYPLSSMPKLGDYAVNEQTMLQLISYVSVKLDSGVLIALSTESLIHNHVDSWELLMKLEALMIEYNCSFLQQGRHLDLLKSLARKIPTLNLQMLMDFSEQLLLKIKQHFMS